MDKIGVDKESWDQVVTSANSSVSAISPLSVQELSNTTLSRMKKLPELENTFNKILKQYKRYETDRALQMKAAGDKIERYDQSSARKIEENSKRMGF